MLNPSVSAAVARNQARKPPSPFRDAMDEAIRMSSRALEANLPTMQAEGWQILDTSNDTEDETLSRILALIAAG